jgi:hypothetical protein
MKQPLFTLNAMERRSTFAATTAGKSFCLLPPVLSWKKNLKVAVDRKVTNDDVISAVANWVTTVNNNKTQGMKELICLSKPKH